MSSQAPAFSEPLAADASASGGAVAGGWPRPLIEAQIAMLGRLAEIGLDVAEVIGGRARAMQARMGAAAADPGASEDAPEDAQAAEAVGAEGCRIFPKLIEGDIALAFARVSRAVRLTLALQARLIDDLKRVDSDAAFAADAAAKRAEVAAPRLKAARVKEIGAVLHRIADVAHPEGEDDLGFDTVTREANEKLTEEEVYGDFLTRPASEIIAHICRDLGLTPDWPRLAQEAWARAEIASGKVGAPLAAVREPFPLADGRTRSEGAQQPAAGMGVTAAELTTRTSPAGSASPPPNPPPSRGRAMTPASSSA